MPSAISLTIGAAIRNENVTPSGMPASTKPMKSGTAEQEQNGVTIPRSAARTLPTTVEPFRSASQARVFSGEKNERMNVIAKMITTSRMKILTVSKMKKFSAEAAGDVGERPRRLYVNQSTAACQGSKTIGRTSRYGPDPFNRGMPSPLSIAMQGIRRSSCHHPAASGAPSRCRPGKQEHSRDEQPIARCQADE